jgi:hypothetical protein
LAKECRVNVEREATAMRDWAKSKGDRKVDWNAAFNGWLRRAAERAAAPPGLVVHRSFAPAEVPAFNALDVGRRINADREAENKRRREAANALRLANDGK